MVWILPIAAGALALAFAKLGAMSVWIVVLSFFIKTGICLTVLAGGLLTARIFWKRRRH